MVLRHIKSQKICLTNFLNTVLAEVLNKGTEKSKRCYKRSLVYLLSFFKKSPNQRNKKNYPSLGNSNMVGEEGSNVFSYWGGYPDIKSFNWKKIGLK